MNMSSQTEHWFGYDPVGFVDDGSTIVILRPSGSGSYIPSEATIDGISIKTSFSDHKIITSGEWDNGWFWCVLKKVGNDCYEKQWSMNDPREVIYKRDNIVVFDHFRNDFYVADVETKHGYYVHSISSMFFACVNIGEHEVWPEYYWTFSM